MGFVENLPVQTDQHGSAHAPSWPGEDECKAVLPVKCLLSTRISTGWDLMLLSLDSFQAMAGEIGILAANSVESNIFLEPEFALAGLQRIEDKGVLLMGLWEELSGTRHLRFFMPVIIERAGLPRYQLLRGFTHHFAPLGTPLLHRKNVEETCENLLRLLGDPELGLPTIIAFDQQRMSGETIDQIKQAATRLGRPFETALNYVRAMMAPAPLNAQPKNQSLDLIAGLAEIGDSDSYLRNSLGRKRQKEYARLLRRLNDHGKVKFAIARKPDAVLDALEGFLTLESQGWKGRGGTSLYSLKQITAFSRQAVAALAKTGSCEIHTMQFGGKNIASLICFRSKGEFFTWKTAFDEAFKPYSPGVQLILKASKHWLEMKHFSQVDSLATANHKMIDHLWRDRQAIGTLLVAVQKQGEDQIVPAARALDRYVSLRNSIKPIIARLRGTFKNKSS